MHPAFENIAKHLTKKFDCGAYFHADVFRLAMATHGQPPWFFTLANGH